MLADICRLVDRNRSIAFYEKAIKVFIEQCLDGFRETAYDAGLDPVGPVQNGQGAVLKDRIGVER